MTSDSITLYTPYYRASSDRRQAELDRCLSKNVDNQFISHIVLIIDDGVLPPINSDKIEIYRVSDRLTYSTWLDLTESRGAHISVLANSDIYFDETLDELKCADLGPSAFVALSRQDEEGGVLVPHQNPHWSQDVWIVRSRQAFPAPMKRCLDFPLGVPRCDNKVAYVFSIYGFSVKNPFQSINAIHVHQSGERGYDKHHDLNILGGVAYVHPIESLRSDSSLEFDIWSLSYGNVSKTQLNPALVNWHKGKTFEEIEKTDAKSKYGSELEERNKNIKDVLVRGDGRLVYSFINRFEIWYKAGKTVVVDTLWKTCRKLPGNPQVIFQKTGQLRRNVLQAFGPDWNSGGIRAPRDYPVNSWDYYFWQYPCLTEKRAFELVQNLDHWTGLVEKNNKFILYLPVPWATLIDKKINIPQELRALSLGISGLKALFSENGERLEVHTVCQHIRWREIAHDMRGIGVTNLHVSHLVSEDLGAGNEFGMTLSSWPLFAVNYEDPGRSKGIVVGRDPAIKKYLASFIGAYRDIYRSDARKSLGKEATSAEAEDILVEINGEWHFEKTVYGEQVSGRKMTQIEDSVKEQETRRYNEILSDSVFSLCPDGTGPNTLRLWESLAVGAIPVVISHGWVPPRVPNSDIQLEDVCIFIDNEDIPGILSRLRSMSLDERRERQRRCLDLYKKIANLSPVDNR